MGRRNTRQRSGHFHPGHRKIIGALAETLGHLQTRTTTTSIPSVGFWILGLVQQIEIMSGLDGYGQVTWLWLGLGHKGWRYGY